MKTRHLMLAALLAAASTIALAEEGADERRITFINPGDFKVGMLNGLVATQAGVTPLRNAPYSGQSFTERHQVLADGNQITSRRSFMAYRDSAGRTRMENMDDKGEVESIVIHDPVAGVNWVLKPQDRSAIKTPARRIAAARFTREQVEQMRKDGTLPTVERRKGADGQEEIVIKRVERVDGETRQRIQEQVRIEARAAADGALRTERVQIASSLASAFGDAKWAAQATTKDLGTRDFSGVKANGKLRSYEIPAGAIGNRNPIVVSTETWISPDLQVTVYTKHTDPRNGDVEFHIENLKREEPAASLFAVPSDYTVKDPLAKLAEKAGKAQ
jgi:hypothetical protein